MILELHGLRIFGRHGAYEDEQRDGQDFLFDIELDVGDRGASDQLAEAIDYAEVAAVVRDLSHARRFDLLEALATETARVVYERFAPRRVKVRVRKPSARPAGLEVEWSAATAELP